jgi:hypothetical protein
MWIRSLCWPLFRGRPFLPLLLLLSAFFVIEFAYPNFPGVDQVFFKSAGLNLSKGGAFAAPELEGFLHADPPLEQVFFVYPPLYPWLFGQWTHATGFGWAPCVGYDALISAGLALIIFGLADAVAGELLGPVSMRRRAALAFLAALLTLVFGHGGRPDELGMALGFANAWWLFRPPASSPRQPGVSFVSGVLAGLMLCTSPGVFLTFISFLAALWLRRVNDWREVAPSLVAAGLGSGLAAALCLTPFFLLHPHFYQQFFQHIQFGVSRGWFYSIFTTVGYAWHYSRPSVFILFATVPVLCLGMVTLWRTGRIWEMLALIVAPLASLGLMSLLYASPYYWWFLQPWFLLLAMVVTADFWWNRRSPPLATVAVGWLVLWLTVASAWPAKNYLVRVTLPPEQRLTPNVQKLRGLIPTGGRVLTSIGWWALGNDRSVYDPSHSDIQDLARIEYFVTDSNGTGQPGVWWPPSNPRYDAMVRESFEVISDTLPRTPFQFFGIRITKSAYGFGTIVMRRVPALP